MTMTKTLLYLDRTISSSGTIDIRNGRMPLRMHRCIELVKYEVELYRTNSLPDRENRK